MRINSKQYVKYSRKPIFTFKATIDQKIANQIFFQDLYKINNHFRYQSIQKNLYKHLASAKIYKCNFISSMNHKTCATRSDIYV